MLQLLKKLKINQNIPISRCFDKNDMKDFRSVFFCWYQQHHFFQHHQHFSVVSTLSRFIRNQICKGKVLRSRFRSERNWKHDPMSKISQDHLHCYAEIENACKCARVWDRTIKTENLNLTKLYFCLLWLHFVAVGLKEEV